MLAQPGERREAVGIADRGEPQQVEAEQDHERAGDDLQNALRETDATGRDEHGAEQRGEQTDESVDRDAREVIDEIGPRPAGLELHEEGRNEPAAHAQAMAGAEQAGHEGERVGKLGDGRGVIHERVCRRNELLTTETDESAIAAAAIIGFRRPAAAMGIATTL